MPLNKAQQELAARYVPFARTLARPFKRSWPRHYDDFDSASQSALVEAAERFNPNLSTSFATFARYRIWGALKDVQRTLVALGWRNNPECAPHIITLPPAPEEMGQVLGIEPTEPVNDPLESLDSVEQQLARLPLKHRIACTWVYIYGRSRNEAAREMRISQSRFSYYHRQAMAILGGYEFKEYKRAVPVPTGRIS